MAALGDVLQIHGQSLGRGIGAQVEPAAQGRVVELEADGLLGLHRGLAFDFERAAAQFGEAVPDRQPKQVIAASQVARQQREGTRIEVGDTPCEVDRAETIGEALEHVFHAGAGASQFVARRAQFLLGALAGHQHAVGVAQGDGAHLFDVVLFVIHGRPPAAGARPVCRVSGESMAHSMAGGWQTCRGRILARPGRSEPHCWPVAPCAS